jgi:hypothetical protein
MVSSSWHTGLGPVTSMSILSPHGTPIPFTTMYRLELWRKEGWMTWVIKSVAQHLVKSRKTLGSVLSFLNWEWEVVACNVCVWIKGDNDCSLLENQWAIIVILGARWGEETQILILSWPLFALPVLSMAFSHNRPLETQHIFHLLASLATFRSIVLCDSVPCSLLIHGSGSWFACTS